MGFKKCKLLIALCMTFMLGCISLPSCNEPSSNISSDVIRLIQNKTAVTFSKIFETYPDVLLPCDAVAHFAIAHLSTQDIYSDDIVSYWSILLDHLDVMDGQHKQLIVILIEEIIPYMDSEDEPLTEPIISYLKAFYTGVMLGVDAQISPKLKPRLKDLEVWKGGMISC